MTRKIKKTDLCINCVNIDNCSYYRNQKEPIIFCEEFSCKEPATSFTEIKSLNSAAPLSLPKKIRGRVTTAVKGATVDGIKQRSNIIVKNMNN